MGLQWLLHYALKGGAAWFMIIIRYR